MIVVFCRFLDPQVSGLTGYNGEFVGRAMSVIHHVRSSGFFAPNSAHIAIVGGGLCGSLAAVVLARAGHQVTLIDRHSVYPKQFRVEKLAGGQVDLMRRLGVLDALVEVSTPFNNILNVRAGSIVDRSRDQHYGVRYEEIVRVVRAQLPSSVEFIIDDVVDLQCGPLTQEVTLAKGEVLSADLILLATGLRSALAHRLGIRQRIVEERHSISFGFTVAAKPGQAFDFEALTCYGTGASNRIDYLSLFPIGNTLRANLFTYLDHQDPWIRSLRRNPSATLLEAMPGLGVHLAPFDPADTPQNWTMDLMTAENVDQDGFVLIGDAFQTSCPAAGTGVTRLLTDIDRLCNVYIPQWLASPGMGKQKMAQFYADPVKQAVDAGAMRMAHFRRALTTDRTLKWRFRRQEHFLRRRVVDWWSAPDRVAAETSGTGT